MESMNSSLRGRQGCAREGAELRFIAYKGIIVSRTVSLVGSYRASGDQKCRAGKSLAHNAKLYTHKKANSLCELMHVFLTLYVRIHYMVYISFHIHLARYRFLRRDSLSGLILNAVALHSPHGLVYTSTNVSCCF